ncbi:hypothetical protein SNEBB_003692 [Seison nebaliae]|nr:hypothetical protein SNEBB_003692 [Seison nebaliae]
MNDRKSISAFLIDITGVLIEDDGSGLRMDESRNFLSTGAVAIDGSIDGINELLEREMPFILCTNESTLSGKDILKRLKLIGFQSLQSYHIFSPIDQMNELIKKENLKLYPLTHPNILYNFPSIDDNIDSYDGVVVGDVAHGLTYDKMNKAFRILKNKESSRLFSLGKSRYYNEHDGLNIDVGAFTTGLEYSADKRAMVIGKPEKEYFENAANKLNSSLGNSCMIGDDIFSDGIASKQAGCHWSFCVRTGKYRKSDEIHSNKIDGHYNNFGSIIRHFFHN